MITHQELMETSIEAARSGAEKLLEWRGKFTAKSKSAKDLVTEADLASQNAVQELIQQKYPEHGFLGEESPEPEQLNKPYCWVVDPLDGTTNYVHGFPCFAVSVAVAHEGELAACAVFDPIMQECFHAYKGGGSWLNGEKIEVSQTRLLHDSLIAVSFPPDLKPDSPDMQAFLETAPRSRAVRRTGSAALNLSYVAAGRLDAHWAHYIHPWDSAAGVLLVLEAGGVVTASRGGNFDLSSGDYHVAATQDLHQELLPLIDK